MDELKVFAGLPVLETVWDLRWMIRLTPADHAAHTNRYRRLSLDVVTPRAWEAAEALDDALEAAELPRTAILELRREYE